MRAKILFGFMAIVTACACNSGPKDYDGHLERLISAVPAQSLEYKDQWLLEYGDFTGDGEDEMLAFVYEETGRYEEMVDGQYYLYYSTRNALTVCDTLYANFYKPPVMMDAGGSTILFYTIGYGGPTGESFCWKCDEDGLVPVPMPGELSLIGDNYFLCSSSGFDSFLADGEEKAFSPGRCFYNYYYFFDGEQFREYGGKELTEDQFSDIPGGAALLNELKAEGFEIEDIYYRANGVIDINCSYRSYRNSSSSGRPETVTSFHYMELKPTDSGFESDGLQPGRIKAALTPESAVYPD